MNLLQLLVGMIDRPRSALTHIKDHPKRIWLLPIGLLMLIPVAATYLDIKLSVTPQSSVYGGLIAAAILSVSALWSIKIFNRREL